MNAETINQLSVEAVALLFTAFGFALRWVLFTFIPMLIVKRMINKADKWIDAHPEYRLSFLHGLQRHKERLAVCSIGGCAQRASSTVKVA